jgi:hypothetical protein
MQQQRGGHQIMWQLLPVVVCRRDDVLSQLWAHPSTGGMAMQMGRDYQPASQ